MHVKFTPKKQAAIAQYAMLYSIKAATCHGFNYKECSSMTTTTIEDMVSQK